MQDARLTPTLFWLAVVSAVVCALECVSVGFDLRQGAPLAGSTLFDAALAAAFALSAVLNFRSWRRLRGSP